MTDTHLSLHASVFSYNGGGCMLIGPSGTGKSRLVADALMMGARLVADDRVILSPMMGLLSAAPPPELLGVMELRGIGLIKINDVLSRHVIHLVVELDADATATRLPEIQREYLGMHVPYLRIPPVPYTSAAMLLLYVKAMQEKRVLPTDWRPDATQTVAIPQAKA